MSFDTGPYLTVAVFCEQVIEDKSGVLSLIRIVDRIYTTSNQEEMPPAVLNWTLVLSIKSGKVKGSRPIKIEPEAPSGLTLPPYESSMYFPGDNQGANLLLKLRMELKEPGVYWFKVYIDGEFATKTPVEVIYTRIGPMKPSAKES